MSSTTIQQKFQRVREHCFTQWQSSDRYKDFIIELSDEDVLLGRKIANERYDSHRELGKKNKTYGYPIKGREVLGCLGELAVIRWAQKEGFDVSMEQFFDTTSEFNYDDNFDTDIVYNGETFSVEVKATEKPMKSKLIIPKEQAENKAADVYVLVCQVDEKRYCIKGFTTHNTVIDNFNDDMSKSAYTVEEKLLTIDLKEILKGDNNEF